MSRRGGAGLFTVVVSLQTATQIARADIHTHRSNRVFTPLALSTVAARPIARPSERPPPYPWVFGEMEAQPFRAWFHWLQLGQSIFGVGSIAIFAMLVKRHSELRQRQFLLIKLLAASDFLFLVFLGPGVGMFPLFRHRGVNSECSLTGRICSANYFCTLSAWWVTFTLLISLMTYALIGFERWWTICFQRGRLRGTHVLWIWLAGVVLVALGATVPFIVPDGGARAMPSGAYCLLRFDSITVTTPVLSVMFFFLAVVGVCYAYVARKIGTVAMKSIRGEDGRESSPFSRSRELTLAAKLLVLTLVYVALWTPALVMIVGQVRSQYDREAAGEPWKDLLAAGCAALASSTSQLQNLVLFDPIRNALWMETRGLACCCTTVATPIVVDFDPNAPHDLKGRDRDSMDARCSVDTRPCERDAGGERDAPGGERDAGGETTL